MKNFRIKYLLFLMIILLTFQNVSASRLAELKVVDKDYLMVHFLDGEVIFQDDAQGSCAYMNCHDQSMNTIVNYGTGLNTAQAAITGSWTIQSADDANYASVGQHPVACYRKSKLNGMYEGAWVSSDFDYSYTMEHYIYLKLPTSLEQGKTYTLTITAGTNSDEASQTFTYDIFNSLSEAVHINLVGYSAAPGIKAADLYFWMGDGGARNYSTFAGNKVYIYNVNTLQSQEVGTVAFWKASAGEEGGYNMTASDVYTADFTGVTEPGTYRLAIEGVGCSQDFRISGDIYYEPFKVSTMGYFYMRIGQDNPDLSPVPRSPLYIPNQSPSNTKVYITTMQPYHPNWGSFSSSDVWDHPADWAAYVKPGNPENPRATGGHSDACDWDRHLGHISSIYDLLLPFILTNGAISDDNLDIAESGNDIPDVLDEARNEVDFWLNLRDGMAYSFGLTNPTSENVLYQAGTNAIAAWASAANSAMLSACFHIAGLTELEETYRDSAIAAYNFAGGLTNQLLDEKLGIGDVIIRGRDLKMMAAAYLYDVTGNTTYEDVINSESVATSDNSSLLDGNVNQLWAVAGYLMTDRDIHYPALYDHMKASVINEARTKEANYTLTRPSRRATDNSTGYFKTAQNVQRTIIAHAVADNPADRELFENALILEADWGLGRNSLNMIQMTTASTSLGSKRSIENLYSTGGNDGTPGMHPGHTPYLNTDDWSTMIMSRPSWMTSKCYPAFSQWPRAEGYFNTRYVWAHSEFTPQQTMRGKEALYGYLYGIGEHFSGSQGLHLTVNGENGAVSKNPDKETYNRGETVILTADPADDYLFMNWDLNASGTDNPLAVVMNGNKIITAVFKSKSSIYSITLTNLNGKVKKAPSKWLYDYEEEVELTATPNDGYSFDGWSGDQTGDDNPAYVIMNGNKNISANFILNSIGIGFTRSNEPGFELFPNPADGEFSVRLPGETPAAALIISDMYGKTVNTGELTKSETRIATTGLSSGVYFVKVVSRQYSSVQKLMVR